MTVITGNKAISNHPAPFPFGRGGTGPSGGVTPDPDHIATATDLPVTGSRGPANGDYQIRNVGINRPLGASLEGDSVVAVLGISFFQATKWKLLRVGDVFRFTQRSTGRFVESHPGVVLTSATSETDAGTWASDGPILANNQPLNVTHLVPRSGGNGLGEENFGDRNCFVGRRIGAQPGWIAERDTQGLRLKNAQSGRYLDAHDVNSFRVVTRSRQTNATQIFDVEIIGGVYTLQHESSTFLDAFSGLNTNAIAVPRQFNSTQQWAIVERSTGNHTMQQISSGRFLSVADVELEGFEAEVAQTVTVADTLFQQFKLQPRG